MTATRRVVIASVREWGNVDNVLEKDRRFEPGTVQTVTFKDEGDDEGMRFGPVTLYANRKAYYLGWLTRRQAGTIRAVPGGTHRRGMSRRNGRTSRPSPIR